MNSLERFEYPCITQIPLTTLEVGQYCHLYLRNLSHWFGVTQICVGGKGLKPTSPRLQIPGHPLTPAHLCEDVYMLLSLA